MTTVRIIDAELRKLTDPSGPIGSDLRRRGQRVLNAARRNCPVDEGRLRASLTMVIERVPGGLVARIGSNLKYARYVHDGTGIYGPRARPITPRNGRWLRWPVKNNSGVGRRRYAGGATAAFMYARSVRGMRGRPFLRDALPAAQG